MVPPTSSPEVSIITCQQVLIKLPHVTPINHPYQQQRDRRLRGSLRDALIRSVEYYHNFWAGSPDPSEEEPLGQLVFGVGDQLGLEQDDTGSDNDVYFAMVCFLNP